MINGNALLDAAATCDALNRSHRERCDEAGGVWLSWDIPSPFTFAATDDDLTVSFFGVEVWRLSERDEGEDMLDALRQSAADLAQMVGVWKDAGRRPVFHGGVRPFSAQEGGVDP